MALKGINYYGLDLPVFPADPVERAVNGRIYFNSTLNVVRIYVNGAWGNLDTAGGTIPAEEVTYDNSTSGLTAADVQDAIDELAAGEGGANTTLSNLADPTQINTSLIPGTPGDPSIGDSVNNWAGVYTNTLAVNEISDLATNATILDLSTAGEMQLRGNITVDLGSTYNIGTSALPLGQICADIIESFQVGDTSASYIDFSSSTLYATDNSLSLNFDSRELLGTDQNPVANWSNPDVFVFLTPAVKLPTGTADPVGVNNGDSYYNTSTNQLRVFNGGTWRGVTLT